MAKATVLMCDLCKSWDGEDNHVKTVSIAGPKLELCTECRAGVLVYVGVNKDLAMRYQQMVDTRDDKAGTWPALSTAEQWRPDKAAELPLEGLDDQGEDQTPAELGDVPEDRDDQPEQVSAGEHDTEVTVADTPKIKAPTRRSRSKE